MLPPLDFPPPENSALTGDEDAGASRGTDGSNPVPSSDESGANSPGLAGGSLVARSLGAVKVGPESFARLAERAMDTPWVPRNPRPIAGPAQVREILELAA